MKKYTILKDVLFQITWTFILSMFIYMIYALLDSDYGIEGLFGWLFIQPIFAAILSFLTILFCLFIGLPIRLNRQLNEWIKNHFLIMFIGIASGILLLVVAYTPMFMETATYCIGEDEMVKMVPNPYLCLAGWLLVNFSALHIYFPRITNKKS